jgi:hypothetical protein
VYALLGGGLPWHRPTPPFDFTVEKKILAKTDARMSLD